MIETVLFYAWNYQGIRWSLRHNNKSRLDVQLAATGRPRSLFVYGQPTISRSEFVKLPGTYSRRRHRVQHPSQAHADLPHDEALRPGPPPHQPDYCFSKSIQATHRIFQLDKRKHMLIVYPYKVDCPSSRGTHVAYRKVIAAFTDTETSILSASSPAPQCKCKCNALVLDILAEEIFRSITADDADDEATITKRVLESTPIFCTRLPMIPSLAKLKSLKLLRRQRKKRNQGCLVLLQVDCTCGPYENGLYPQSGPRGE